jgi:hypothetical protein
MTVLRLVPVALIAVAACGTGYLPPEPVAPRPLTTVNASFGRTWNATIDAFADDNIPIANMDRASGFISAQVLTLSSQQAFRFANCGTVLSGGQRLALAADRVTYNVVVRGDSATTTVKITSLFIDDSANAPCVSRGEFEGASEAEIKRRAERP